MKTFLMKIKMKTLLILTFISLLLISCKPNINDYKACNTSLNGLGTLPHGQTTSVTCSSVDPNAYNSGNMTYKCADGEISLLSQNCNYITKDCSGENTTHGQISAGKNGESMTLSCTNYNSTLYTSGDFTYKCIDGTYQYQNNNCVDVPPTDSPFGIAAPYSENYTISESNDLLLDIGAEWVRLLQPELEASAASLLNQKINIISGVSSHLYPTDMDGHIQELKLVVEKYKDQIKTWMICNEADLNWRGNIEKYVQYFIEVSNAIKSVSPDIKIALSLAGAETGKIGRRENPLGADFLKAALSYGIAPYFDILDVHVYWKKGEQDDFIKMVSEVKKIFQENNISQKSIWIAEFGTYDGEPDRNFLGELPLRNESEQAAELVKKYVIGLSQKIDKIFWATMEEWSSYNSSYKDFFAHIGLINNPNNLSDRSSHKKLAYYSYKLLTTNLRNADWKNAEVIEQNNGVYIYKLNIIGSINPVWIAWAENKDSNYSYNIDLSLQSSLTNASSMTTYRMVPEGNSGEDITDDLNTYLNKTSVNVNEGKISVKLNSIPIIIKNQM